MNILAQQGDSCPDNTFPVLMLVEQHLVLCIKNIAYGRDGERESKSCPNCLATTNALLEIYKKTKQTTTTLKTNPK